VISGRELVQRLGSAWAALTLKQANPTSAAAGAMTPGVGMPWPNLMAQPSPGLALRSSAVWACVNIISKAVASLPAQVFEATPQGSKPAPEHPLYAFLTRSPNPMMTLQQWLQPTMLHLLLWGNAFTYIDYQDGEIVGLWPLLPARMRIVYTSNQTVQYSYFDWRGQAHYYTPGVELIPFRVFSLDGYIGLSVLQYQAMTLDFQDMSATYALNLYRNGGRPTGVLEYPNQLAEQQVQRIRQSWQDVHGGVEGAGKVAILENGAKYSAITLPPEQLQYIDTQKFSVEQIARIFGVAPHMIGAAVQPTYASVEQQSIEFVRYTLQPYVHALESQINAHLLEAPYTFRMNMNAFERGDVRSRYAAYATGRQWGWLSANDIRQQEDLNSIGPEGDIYLQPLNMVAAGTPVEDMPPPTETIPKGAP
jgi:HK97 family phage portal protein